MTSNGAGEMQAQARVAAAIQQLAAANGELASVLAELTAVVAEEALQNAKFLARLNDVLVVERSSKGSSAKARPKRGRRAPGPWDPYNVYAEVGEAGLRDRLSRLELGQLRDIIAEHGMNTDGLAMRWTKTDRVVGRIVERVVDRAGKGDAFRHA